MFSLVKYTRTIENGVRRTEHSHRTMHIASWMTVESCWHTNSSRPTSCLSAEAVQVDLAPTSFPDPPITSPLSPTVHRIKKQTKNINCWHVASTNRTHSVQIRASCYWWLGPHEHELSPKHAARRQLSLWGLCNSQVYLKNTIEILIRMRNNRLPERCEQCGAIYDCN